MLAPRAPFLLSVLYQGAFLLLPWRPTPSSLGSKLDSTNSLKRVFRNPHPLRIKPTTEICHLSLESYPYSFTHTCRYFRKCLLGVCKRKAQHNPLPGIILWDEDWGLDWSEMLSQVLFPMTRGFSLSQGATYTPAHTQIPINYNAFWNY